VFFDLLFPPFLIQFSPDCLPGSHFTVEGGIAYAALAQDWATWRPIVSLGGYDGVASLLLGMRY
jgi:hypothetical protein